MGPLVAYAAREIAVEVVNWAKTKVRDYVYDKAERWISAGRDWVVEKITGKARSKWDDEGKGLAYAALDARTLSDSRALVDVVRELLLTPEGKEFSGNWLDQLQAERDHSPDKEQMWINIMPIPREETLLTWATRVGSILGLPALKVLQRRKDSI
jgi:sucrose-6-phosphate hydrolase SacC (GH32 family)